MDAAGIAALDGVPAATAKRLERYAVAIDQAYSGATKNMLSICRLLSEAHAELSNHGDGTFVAWVESRCQISKRSAFRYLAIHRTFGDEDCASLAQSAPIEALEFLARDTTPEAAIEAAKELAESGERITLAKAKELVANETLDGTTDDEWCLADAILKVDTVVDRLLKEWPQECHATLGQKLIAAGEWISKEGAEQECSLKESA